MVLRRGNSRSWMLAALFVALGLLIAEPALAITARVTGTVTDAQGNPLQKVLVLFEASDVQGRAQGSVIGKLKTKKNGSYTYPFLDTGTWKIYPQFEGYLVLKMSVLSMDSQGEIRMQDDEIKISRNQSNIPEIPVPPQGQGAVVRGQCVVNFVMVPEADYSTEMAKLQGKAAPAPAQPAAPVVAKKRDPVERGDEFFAGGDFDQAAAAYQEAIEADPARAEAYYGLGKSLLRKDDLGGAQSALMKAAELDPELPGVNFYLGTIYHSLAQDTAAIAAFEKERANSPDQEEVLVNLASLYRDTDQLDKAEALLKEVMELFPENTDAALAMADVYNAENEPEKAEEIYRQILARNPGQEDVIWYNIGVNAFNAGKQAEAAQAFEKSLAANKKNPDSHKMLGYALVGLGKADEAIPHFEAYLKLEKGPEAQQVAAFLEQLKKG